MLTLRYTKSDSAIFISHIDLLKQFVKIINRAKINVEYTKGFHPHMQIYFTTPLPVGVSSETEYVTIVCKEESIIDKLNEKTIGGITFTKEFTTLSNPKLTSQVDRASYVISQNLDDISKQKLEEFFNKESIKITVERKGELTEKEVKPLIYDYKLLDNAILLTLASGNTNLRIDQLIKTINSETGLKLSITKSKKIGQIMSCTGENVEDYLERIKA